MAITENKYTGNGSTVLYSFTFPYLEVADIKVSLDGTLTTAYTLANATTVQFNTAPANGVAIRLFRQTNDEALNAQFFPGSAIRSTDLNNNFTQNLYVTQESNRDATQGITTADAATATANTALSNSSAAVSTANTASSNASAAVSTANTASSNASAAVSTANTASSNATTAVSTANAATATANSAASDAATAISTANSAVSTANTASTAATNAVNTANSASSAASSAVSTANTASSNASAAVSTANTASSNATSAVNTANSALSTANAAASAVANAILYDIVANVAAIPASPANNDAVEVTDSTGIESFTPLISIPGGFAGNSGLSVRIVYTTTGNTWTWIQYFPNDPETRYLKEAVTTSDTAPVSPSDGDLWYDSVGGRTYVYYDDGDTSQWVDTSPQGSGVSDAISEGDTSAEVIDTGSDGRFVVTTEGSERLRVNSSGNLGLGTASPTDTGGYGRALDIQSNTGAAIYLRTNDDTSQIAQGSSDLTIRTRQAHPIIFNTNNTERLRITSAGLVGIGTSSPSVSLHVVGGGMFASSTTGGSIVQARNSDFSSLGYFGVEGSTGGVTLTGTLANSTFISSGASGTPLQFGTGGVIRSTLTSTGLGIGTTSPDANLDVRGSNASILISDSGRTQYWRIQNNETNDALVFNANDASERMRILSSGNVGIGTTTVDYKLDVNGSAQIRGGESLYFQNVATNGRASIQCIGVGTNTDLRFSTGGSERVRIDSSGRLLVGTSSGSGNNLLQVQGESGSSAGIGGIVLRRGLAPSLLVSGSIMGRIDFGPNDGGVGASIVGEGDAQQGTSDYPSRLVFSTTADGASSPTERMRITNLGVLKQSTTGTYLSTTARYNEFSNLNATSGDINTYFTLGANTSDTSSVFIYCFQAGVGGKMVVYGNGNIQNTNNSYGALSDIKLKENIVDANSQWDDLKALQVRKYNFKEGQTHTQIGLIAQEVELVSPGLVSESPDRDEDGNDLGTVTKSVNYSVLYMKAVKALQEAMTRIETLEAANTDLAARLTALEGGTN
jgi:hypothetical protein